jgi:ubiquinone biosynthesis accessory factor UbiJ
MTFAAKPFTAVVNHLLARETWARERLMPYAGKTARVSVPPVALALAVQPDGYFAVIEGDGTVAPPVCDVSIALAEGSLAAFMRGGQAAVMKHVKIEGDAEFAAQLAKLAEHLRWDAEEDLARLIGDAPAYRAASLTRSVFGQAQRAGRNLLETVAEYWLDEDPQIVRRTSLGEFEADLHTARDALARLEKRVERLEARRRVKQ